MRRTSLIEAIALALITVGSPIAASSAGAVATVGPVARHANAPAANKDWVWSTQATPNVTGAEFNELIGVSCPSAIDCMAVGGSYATGRDQVLADQWKRGTWAVVNPIRLYGAGALYAVSCVSASYCLAVGGHRPNDHTQEVTLVEQWNGTSWKIQGAPEFEGVLSSVSCPTLHFCVAVGAGQSVIEMRSYSTWTVPPLPLPAGTTETSLTGVSCASATACIAVGTYNDNTNKTSGGLALAWNGTSWSLQSIALPAGATGGGFQGVSCASPTTCIGVGSAGEGTTSDALVELWNGSKWTVSAPVATVPGTYLSGVSCTSVRTCTVVGASPTGPGGTWATVAQRWNGLSWAAEQTPNAASPYGSLLNQVSCHGTEACTAVGTYVSDSSNDQSTLAEARQST
jgi:hypothetical protein